MDKVLPIASTKRLHDLLSNLQARLQLTENKAGWCSLIWGCCRGQNYRRYFPYYISNGVGVEMFADEVSLLCTHPYKLSANTYLQEAVTRVAEWTEHRKIK